MKMVFIDGGHRINITKRNINNTNTMQPSKREMPKNRFNMDQSMRLKKVGCGSCSGVR